MQTLEGKVAIVTGAGQGVGEGVALALAEAGARVVAAGRTASKVERTVDTIAEHKGVATALECDVTDPVQIQACVDLAVSEYGTVDILVNNAQVPPLGPIAEIPEELFDMGWRTGPLATFRFMRACYPYLKGGGVVVNMGSGSAIRPDLTAFGAYGACKEAIRTMSRAAACEWGRDGIRVNVVLPLALSPGMAGFLEEHPEARDGVLGAIPLGFIGDSEQHIGPAVVWLCSDAASYVTGTSLCVDGGQDYVR
jgi:meso-butanediol dehydrogenase / (S,S)-butanediol dehydrogenase / diacetyl reductase